MYVRCRVLETKNKAIIWAIHSVDFDGSGKEFWGFVGRRKKEKIIDVGVFVTSTGDKLEVLQRHCQHLRKNGVDSDFDANWKKDIESEVSNYGSTSE